VPVPHVLASTVVCGRCEGWALAVPRYSTRWWMVVGEWW
jgi:hypothetical protein